jgi:hypothetical protein
MEVTPSNNIVLGYGSIPKLKVFDQAGNVVLDVPWARQKLYRATGLKRLSGLVSRAQNQRFSRAKQEMEQRVI